MASAATPRVAVPEGVLADTFNRSMRCLRAERGLRGPLALLALVLLLGAWGGWLIWGRVTVYAMSQTARLEVDRASHPIESPVTGRVVRSELTLDQAVTVGQVLVELDSEAQRLQLEQERIYQASLGPQLAAAQAELKLREQASSEDRNVAVVRISQARSEKQAAEAASKLAEQQRRRANELFDAGAASVAEVESAAATAQQRSAEVAALSKAPERIGWEYRRSETDRRAGIEELRRQVVHFESEVRTVQTRIDRLEYEIAQRRIVAPVAGRLGEIAVVRVGQFVELGEKLAAVVPLGEVHVVAQFAPAAALGRVRAGAAARVRLEGFPWTQYGTVQATVQSVGSEVRDGTVRVQLAVKPRADSVVPLQHGLPGSVEIEVERVSPAVLLLRLAGKLLPAGQAAPVQQNSRPNSPGPGS